MSSRSDPVEIARFLELPLDDYDDNQCTSSATAYCYEPYLDQQQKVSAKAIAHLQAMANVRMHLELKFEHYLDVIFIFISTKF